MKYIFKKRKLEIIPNINIIHDLTYQTQKFDQIVKNLKAGQIDASFYLNN